MPLFLLVYDQRMGAIEKLMEFPDSERERALTERFALEESRLQEPHVEVIILSASTREALMQTHSRYFKGVSELAAGD